MKLGIIGNGRAAWAFASTWRRIGWPLTGIATRGAPIDELAKSSDLILVAVSDRAIVEVAESIPETDAVIFHPSGALPALRGGFSLHPLKSLPPADERSDLEGTLLVFEGNHRDVAEQIAKKAGARFAEISREAKIRYHAGAVFGSNYIAALLDIAEELIGIDGAREDIAALARSAIDNWAAHTDARRFTGPASRGDDAVMQQHQEALRDSPELAEIYRLLAARIVAAAK
ncbi:MAG TPA: DUF2520 domain-containing protein [Thermoanaerobaculia bacterium]|jgi:predicted short-subunit dehydrogenase-like oxidoreductase (DUF2520 family)|nr:DUF2520 domain-containing protein [Thermoanaerobaculia bacterium]